MTTKHHSAVVNILSGLAFTLKKSAPIYCASKSAIHIATKALCYQLENTTIKVFEIIPPLVDTLMTSARGKGKILPKQRTYAFLKNFINNKLKSNIGNNKVGKKTGERN